MNKLVLQYLNCAPQSPSNSRTNSCDSTNSNKTNPQSQIKYKTELCRTFEERGYCPYAHKCRFAHGKTELVVVETESSKKKRCNGFWMNGCCSYGRRCKFGHDEINWENTACLMAFEAHCENMPCISNSKLMKLLQWFCFNLISHLFKVSFRKTKKSKESPVYVHPLKPARLLGANFSSWRGFSKKTEYSSNVLYFSLSKATICCYTMIWYEKYESNIIWNH